ncbi:fimbria/pilus chaperone family protein [Serratia fonticola]
MNLFGCILLKHKHDFLLTLSLFLIGSIFSAQASFQLESTGIVLKENEGRVSFNVNNTSLEPILLASKLEDLDKKEVSKNIIISPPIIRIDAGQSQQVNFVLKKGSNLKHETLLRASFEGVVQSVDNSARIPVRQSIGFLIQPTSVSASKTPWESLDIRLEGSKLVVSNTGRHVVRLAPMLTLLPSRKTISLKEQYFLVGDIYKFDVGSGDNSLMITPFSRYGFKIDDVTLPIKR